MDYIETLESKIAQNQDGKFGKSWLGGYTYLPTGKKLKSYKIYIEAKNAEKFIQCMKNKEFANIEDIKKTESSNYLVTLYASNDGEYCILQLSTYVPFNYQPYTEVCEYQGKPAGDLWNWAKG